MLSDYERRVLRELEGQFRSDDPEFTGSFDARQQRLGRDRLPTFVKCAITVALLLSGLMFVTGGVAGALLLSGATGLAWLVWWWSGTFGPQETQGPLPRGSNGR